VQQEKFLRRRKLSDLTIFWKIKKITWDEATGGVVLARWAVVVSDGENSVETLGTSRFNPNPESESYIPLDILEEETVIEWSKNNTPDYKNTEQRAIKNFYKKIKINKTTSGNPWGPQGE
jgi:hypothetical protein